MTLAACPQPSAHSFLVPSPQSKYVIVIVLVVPDGKAMDPMAH